MADTHWNKLAERFNTHKSINSIHPDAAVNIVVGWPYILSKLEEYKQQQNKDHLNILDFGCGSGALCKTLYDKGHTVTGYDISKRMLETAKENTSKDITYIHAEEKDLNHEQFKEKFDLIISMHSLEWIENVEETLIKLAKNLKKNGLLIFAIFPKEHVIESLEMKDLFEDFDDLKNPTKGFANFDGIKIPVYIREPKFFDKILDSIGFEKMAEYLPQYPEHFFEIYKWTGAKYPEMVILSYKKL